MARKRYQPKEIAGLLRQGSICLPFGYSDPAEGDPATSVRSNAVLQRAG